MKEEFAKEVEGIICFYLLACENVLTLLWVNANVTDDNLPFCQTSFYLDLNRREKRWNMKLKA